MQPASVRPINRQARYEIPSRRCERLRPSRGEPLQKRGRRPDPVLEAVEVELLVRQVVPRVGVRVRHGEHRHVRERVDPVEERRREEPPRTDSSTRSASHTANSAAGTGSAAWESTGVFIGGKPVPSVTSTSGVCAGERVERERVRGELTRLVRRPLQ